MTNEILKEIASIVGNKFVTDREGALIAYSYNDVAAIIAPPLVGTRPDIIVKPGSASEISHIVGLANKYKIPITPAGGREGFAGGSIPTNGGILIDLTRLNNVINIDYITRSVRVEAGISYLKLKEIVEHAGYRLGNLGPSGPIGATVGGAISLHATGLGGQKYGQVGEEILSLQVVLPNGDIIETGSRQNPYAAGEHRYCLGADMTGLFIGAAGAFGIITEASFMLHPREDVYRSNCYSFFTIEDACEALYEMDCYGYIDKHYIYLGEEVLKRMSKPGTPGYLDIRPGSQAVLKIMLEDVDEKIADRKLEILDYIAEKHNGKNHHIPFVISPEMSAKGSAAPIAKGINCFCETVYPIKKVPELAKYIMDEWQINNAGVINKTGSTDTPLASLLLSGSTKHAVTDFTYIFSVDIRDSKKAEIGYKAWHELLDYIYKAGATPHSLAKDGYTPHWKAYLSEENKRFYKNIKRALDPNNIMNPGALLIETDSKEGI